MAIDFNEEDITSLNNRGEVYYRLKIWDLAEQDFDAVIKKDPKGNTYWATQSQAMKKKVQAIRAAEKK